MKVFIVDLLCISPFYDKYLVQAIQKQGVDVEFFATSFVYEPSYWRDTGMTIASGLCDNVALRGIRVVWLRRLLQIKEYICNWRLLLQQAKQRKPDLVHIQWLPLLEKTTLELTFLRTLNRMKIPVVYTCHNALPHESHQRLIPRYARLYKEVSHIIVHSAQEKHRLISQLDVDAQKISIVGHGPLFGDLNVPSKEDAKKILGYLGGVIMFVGIVRPYKGIHVLLKAWNTILSRHPHTILVVAGQSHPKYKVRLQREVQLLGISDRVRFLDEYVRIENIPLLHAAADVAVFPYLHATQSGALLTAVNFNAPVVATGTGGFSEVIEHGVTGFLATPGDTDSLASALDTALKLTDEARESMVMKLRHKVDRDYGWQTIADQTIQIYAQTKALEGSQRG
jgi:glycosyltransferase involved in cell wall biosynthesis